MFHILTIGSSKLEHELYGFHRGYFVSPHHVAETIRNFIAYFLSCEVCRTNYLVSMSVYDHVCFSIISSYLLESLGDYRKCMITADMIIAID